MANPKLVDYTELSRYDTKIKQYIDAGDASNVISPLSISILTPPVITEYSSGDTLDLTGMVVVANYSDASQRNITSACTYSPANGATLTGSESQISVSWNGLTASQSITVSSINIYGVYWSGGSGTTWSRTDSAENFTNPVPAVNNGNGSSPFDNCMPWSGIKRVTDSAAGELVEIPKFWYKWTRSGDTMKLQIADGEVDGFHVSPAHADRGDGKGERDVVYVGRYHCSSSNYKSVSGVSPKVSVTRASFRSSIHNLGSTIWQQDFAMFWTIRMLYLVEYANWNSQAVIGYGCGTGSLANEGFTDSMQYHTGTTAASRTTYGHVQYRYIEGLWSNVWEFVDGIYFSGSTVYCIKNPSSFSDTSGGTSVGARTTSSNEISKFTNPTASGFEYALYPSAVVSNSNYNTYVCDYCYYGSSGVVLCVGGGYVSQGQDYGLFYMDGYYTASYSYSYIGSRLQKLP